MYVALYMLDSLFLNVCVYLRCKMFILANAFSDVFMQKDSWLKNQQKIKTHPHIIPNL